MQPVTVCRADGIATVTLQRPERKNALTRAMVDELRTQLEEIGRRREDRVLVLTGAGGAFCSGADLADSEGPALGDPAAALEFVRRVGDVALALHRVHKPTIARVDGDAVGAGLGLALGCDLIVASDRARFSMIFTRRALSPDNGTSWLLPRLVGMARAKELAFFGEVVGAEEARRLGLVNRVVPVGELDDVVGTWARRLAAGPALALSMTKSLLHSAWSVSLAEAVELEAQCQAANIAGADTKEAISAFLERREPRYARP